MAMFEKFEQPVKFWVVQAGVAGTAHMGRDSSVKDFRAARCWVSQNAGGERRVSFRAAKGAEVYNPAFDVSYRAVAVEYRPNLPPVVTWEKGGHVQERTVYDSLPETVVEVFENHFGAEAVIYGFPPPDWKESEIEAARAERAAKAAADIRPAPVSRQEFLAWAEAQTGQTRRWLRRLAATGKAGDQVYGVTRQAFPGRQFPLAYSVLRDWLTTEDE